MSEADEGLRRAQSAVTPEAGAAESDAAQAARQLVQPIGEQLAQQATAAAGGARAQQLVGTASGLGGAAIAQALRQPAGSAGAPGGAPGGFAQALAGSSPLAGAVAQVAEIAAREVGALFGASGIDPLPRTRYGFEAHDGPHGWVVLRVALREALSELYAATIDLVHEDPHADSSPLLGTSCVLTIGRVGVAHERRLCGLVHRLEQRGTRAGHALVRVHVVPALWVLSQRVDSFVFQDMTVPEVLAAVLGEALGPLEREAMFDELAREYPKREYCVQYQESDLEFALRLMEEEGITFRFAHDGDKEVLVLSDSNEAFAPLATMDGGAVPVLGAEGAMARVESVREFDWRSELGVTQVMVRDYDWTRPSLDLSSVARGSDARRRTREVYEAAPELTIGEYRTPNYTATDERPQGVVRRDARVGPLQGGSGDSNVITFSAGATFQLDAPGRDELSQAYLITRVEHRGEAPEVLVDAAADASRRPHQAPHYANTFECAVLDGDVPFRPARRTTRRRISGVQTALVVGPASEEIYTDEHGRIKVQFRWDREGQRDEGSSCWVRVAQAWSGAGWGFVFVPRVGMEVIVSFVEGNPDRPLVTGCVYNGENTPPYALPDQKTRSTIKTRSTPGGDGANELRFDDAAGSEEVFVHAQKDYNEVVEHDHATVVHASQTNSVDGGQSESVGGDASRSVGGNETITVRKNRTETVHGHHAITVQGSGDGHGVQGGKVSIAAGNYAISVAAGDMTVTSPTKISLTVGGSSITIEPGKITLAAAGGANVVLDANALMHGADAKVDGGATAEVTSPTTTLTGSTKLDAGGATATLHGTNVTVLGQNTGISGTAQTVVVGNGAALTLTGTATLASDAATTVSGTPLNLNGTPTNIN